MTNEPKHIRPRVQRKSPKAKANVQTTDDKKTATEIEETRKRMESWMGLGSSPQAKTAAAVIVSNPTSEIQQQPQKQKQTKNNETPNSFSSSIVAVDVPNNNPIQPKSILKKPKYSNKSTVVSPTPVDLSPPQPSTIVNGDSTTTTSSTKSSVICKDIVVERDPSAAATKLKSFRKKPATANHASIEGYVPQTNEAVIANDDNNGEPLIIDSLEGLMKAAGESLPENPGKITADTKMVEANISFSVMTQDQYNEKLPTFQQEHEEERQRQMEVFMGKHDIFDDDEEETLEGQVDNDDDDEEEEDAVMELLMGSDLDTDDEEPEERTLQVKAFTLLWDALTNWMTHETVVWMKSLTAKGNTVDQDTIDREWTLMVDKSDIGASRCAGVLAMLRLYLTKCMDELGHPMEVRAKAEQRLAALMRTFDYSRENPKLSAGHWKAMACVLLDAVLVETRSDSVDTVPPSVSQMGMSAAEFEYLSRKAVLIFDS